MSTVTSTPPATAPASGNRHLMAWGIARPDICISR